MLDEGGQKLKRSLVPFAELVGALEELQFAVFQFQVSQIRIEGHSSVVIQWIQNLKCSKHLHPVLLDILHLTRSLGC